MIARIALLLALAVSPSGELVLENEFVRLAVDAKSGAVTSLIAKKAPSFPVIAERGAGVAGRGTLFAWDGAAFETADRSPGELVIRSKGRERRIRMDPQESGFRLQDTLRNEGPEPQRLQVRGRSRIDGEKWRLKMLGSSGARAQDFYWRTVTLYGVGFLYQGRAPAGPATVEHKLGAGASPSEFVWDAPAMTVAPGQTVSWTGAVLVDVWGRDTQAPGPDRVILTADLRVAGTVGEPVPAAATVVSATPRRVKIVTSPPAGDAELDLVPGVARIAFFDFVPKAKGELKVTFTAVDAAGKELARAGASALIDGGAEEAWKVYTRRMPEQVYRGTWREIGAQLVKSGKLGAKVADPTAGERLALYRRKFPFYAEMLEGAAQALGVEPERLALPPPRGPELRFGGQGLQPMEPVRLHAEANPPTAEACMDVFFDGPDGPINAFSKERENANLGGLGYLKVKPTRGYAYQMYIMPPRNWSHGYGVNSEGLSTSGATLNCDGETTRKGRAVTADWIQSGKAVAPIPMNMILAMCKNVDEAIAFIEDAEAPLDFEGNLLLVDRAGKAARVESVGIFRQVIRHDGKGPGCFVAGNYANPRTDGFFRPGTWEWAANTMLRERFLTEVVGVKPDRMSLKDVFRAMETHAAGGMCQHVVENPGSLYSSTSFVAVTRTSELWLSHGPPCQVRTLKYTLD